MTRSLLWCRRNPAGVALAVTAALGIMGITWNWRIAIRERGDALAARKEAQDQLLAMRKAKAQQDREALRAQVIADFLARDLLGQTEPGDDGRAGSLTVAPLARRGRPVDMARDPREPEERSPSRRVRAGLTGRRIPSPANHLFV